MIIKRSFGLIFLLVSFISYSQEKQDKKGTIFAFIGFHKSYFDYHIKGNDISMGLYKKYTRRFILGIKYSFLTGEGYKKFTPLVPVEFYDEKTNIYYKTGSINYYKFSFFMEHRLLSNKFSPFLYFSPHMGWMKQHLYSQNEFIYDDHGVVISIKEDSGENGLTGGIEIGLGLNYSLNGYEISAGGYYGSTIPANSTYTLLEIKFSKEISF
ncbi:MAG: hypothetical protein GXO27_06875 [Chlorobi bacterium]|nr:hypothetical protein [Chlorobiota bacterium]